MAIYASSDWHGQGELGMAILDWLKPDDKLYFLGDAADRGPDGIKLMMALLKDKRVTYLKGNHEQFMINSLLKGEDNWLWMVNGGLATEEVYAQLNYEDATWLIHKLDKLPLTAEVRTQKGLILMEHAGRTVGVSDYRHDPLWDRDHFYEAWSDDPKDKDTYMVHGHTPVQYLIFETGFIDLDPEKAKELKQSIVEEAEAYYGDSPYVWRPDIVKYCGGHKIDIDLGAFQSGRIAVLDLDTLEPIYFTEEGE